ncbi:MAG TPA: DUF3135 domain-containing protein [Gammaproteobacteria bacterium]|nr:DUF3135 domain-containing protein [Gammaproteobacteria bacterium]
MSEIRFDAWRALAENDPARFEAERRECIRALIESVPAERRERLERLQWRIDRERERARNPIGACVRLSRMMWDSFAGEDGLADMLDRFRARRPPPTQRRRAEVIPFRGRH